MNTMVKNEPADMTYDTPGIQLARMREKKGYSQEYVASKLHLRNKIIELLEADEYQQLPEEVFIKGYIRAYAKLLETSPEPLLKIFNNIYAPEKKLERTLWQSRRESHYGERVIRWLSGLTTIITIIIVGIWWQKSKINQPISAASVMQDTRSQPQKNETIKLTKLSTMQNLFSLHDNENISVSRSISSG